MTKDNHYKRRLGHLVIALLLVLPTPLIGTACISPARAQSNLPNYITEYRVPTQNSAPLAIAVDPTGDVWFTESNASKLAVFNPMNQSFHEFKVPWVGDMWGIIADKAGNIWATHSSAKGAVSPGGAIVSGGYGSIIRFTPATENFTQIAIPTVSSFPLRLQEDQEGRIWFTELLGNKIGVYDPSINSLREYPVPTNTSGPADLTFDTKGNIWFTEAYASQVGEFNPTNQSFVEYPLGGNSTSDMVSSPVGIAIDQQGIVWVADHGGNWILKFNPKTKTTTKYTTHFPPSNVYPISLVNDLLIDKQGRVWFTEHGGNSIGYFIPQTQSMVEFPIPTGPISTVLWLTLAPTGNIWFAEWSGNNIGTISSNTTVPIVVSTSSNSISVNQGDQFTLPVEVKVNGNFSEIGYPFFAWGSYNPNDVSASFNPSNLQLSASPMSVQGQFTVSKNADPGNYSMAVGIESGSVRVMTLVSVLVVKYNAQSRPILLTLEIVVVVIAAAAALTFFLRRRSKRSSPPSQMVK
ncbi:MAG TPA: hypothetical protein VLV31_02995 [Candidatus Acidoferrales bacterium]|nr:hypothetical protein [Candidatus Acidoferrales bacterium]